MTREELTKNLNYTKNKHKDDVIDTFGTDISLMCEDILRYLEQEKQSLDKAIEEINEKFDGCDICEWFDDYDWDENNVSEYRYVGSVEDILDIIKKHLSQAGA